MIPFLSKHWLSVLLGASVVALGIRLYAAELTIAKRDTMIAQQGVDMAGMKASIAGQNASIEAWKAVAEDRKELSAKLLGIAKEATAVRSERIESIMREPVPTPDAECAATLDLLRKYQ